MAGAVVLLVLPGLLVLPDQVALVVVDVHAADHAGLRAPVHDLAVEEEPRVRVLQQRPAGEELVQRAPGPGVDPGVVGVDVVGQIDVRAAHMEEAVRVPAGQLGRLGTVDDVIGDRRHLGGEIGVRADRTEGIQAHGGPYPTRGCERASIPD